MSNLDKLLGTVVYLYRFIRNCRRADSKEATEISEHQWAWYACIRAVQGQSFPDELRQLRLGKDLSRRSRFRRLSPFIDTRGLFRVGGRLDEAVMAYDAKHPPILPSRHHLTNLLIRKVHSQNCHAGIEATLSLVRAHAWIVDGRAAVRRVVGQCTVCRRYESNPSLPKMAPLPPSRLVRPPAPFARVGMDFMGPIMVTCRRSQVKRWICLFTCMAIRAVHLEICYSLDVSSFLSAFRRFVARRGPPSDCYSDNGTNFRAAARVLSPEAPHWDSVEISNFMTSRGIKWHFNPPSAPHFGGAWERLIRSAKIALRETLHGQRITDEALQTIVVEIEFMLNCRPLTHVSIDPSDPEPLTPNHFLQGRPFSHVPTDIVQQDNKISRRSWLFVQATLDRYWKRWMKEYVPTLAPGLNKGSDHANIAVDSVVLVVDPQAPRGRWLMGRVTRVFPGKDGTTRVAEVKTINGLMRRPLVKLLALPVVSQQETGGGMLTP
uniref:Integrase catalytic domain-containing protein n=1 Tax=Trichuris muris TaxID=70415 RepID=A0A5S6Q4J4_TRIMR